MTHKNYREEPLHIGFSLVTYKLEDFSGKQITRRRRNIVPITRKNFFSRTNGEILFE